MSLVALGGIFALLSHVLPEREEVRRAVSLLFSVLLLVFLFRPFLSLDFLEPVLDFKEDIQNSDAVTEGEKDLAEQRKAAVKEGIREKLCDKFDLDPENLRVEADFLPDFSLTRLTVYLSGRDALSNLVAIERYGRENFYENFEVKLDGSHP